jgi:hypothetical protein
VVQHIATEVVNMTEAFEMLPKQSIAAQAVLNADLFVHGQGVRRSLRRLERAEPDLAEYLMETSVKIYADLDDACPSHRKVKRIHTNMMLMTLVCIETRRRSA